VPAAEARQGCLRGLLNLRSGHPRKEFHMPVILWLLGVPLVLVLLLMFMHII
jgi:hypothetical protein